MRPATLKQVAELTLAGESFSYGLRNFLDEFLAQPTPAALDAEPPMLDRAVDQGAVLDAYLAATAEALAGAHGLPTPPWTRRPERALRRPWFAVPWAGMRAVLLLESPAAFRARNLFVTANALSRA